MSHGAGISVEEAMDTRKAVRAFDRTRSVDRAQVERILDRASRAPSDNNIQQWSVCVVGGKARNQMVQEATELRRQGIIPGPLPIPPAAADPDSQPKRTPK